jgi:hypothetical protein
MDSATLLVNLDPVISHLGADNLPCCLRNNRVGRFDRHVTVDAVIRYLVPHGFGHPAAFHPVTGYDARGVTLQTTRDDGTREIHGAIFITRTVDPAAPVGPITYRQLKPSVIVPVQVALPSHTRSDHNIHSFAFSLQLSRPAGHRRLVKPVRLSFHLEIKSRGYRSRSRDRRSSAHSIHHERSQGWNPYFPAEMSGGARCAQRELLCSW